MIKVAVNGYGTIGKRVADAVAAQPDMEGRRGLKDERLCRSVHRK